MEKENAYKKINKIKQILLIIIFLLIIWIIGIIAGTYYFNLSNNKKENGGEISGINKGLQANTSTYVYEFSDVETINSISFKFKVTAKDLLESNPKIGEEYNLSVLDHKIVIPYIKSGKSFLSDYKSALQEMTQMNKKTLEYVLVNEYGPSHDKTFEIEVKIDNIIYGKGIGKSKKEAEQKAARDAFRKCANNFK